jgi:metal-sulfur cluster biosynthetic enzyme
MAAVRYPVHHRQLCYAGVVPKGGFAMSASITEESVLSALDQVLDPELHHSIVKLGFIRDMDIADDYVHLDIQLTTPHCPRADEIIAMIEDAVSNIEGVSKVEVDRACKQED